MFSNPDVFVNLEDYKKGELLKDDPDISVYEIFDQDTKYIANIFKKNISKYPKEKLVEFSNHFTFISKFNHPSILKYTGYSPVDFDKKSRPVVVTDTPITETLNDVFESSSNIFNSSENDVKKSIIIYGIASAMSYLHSHDIIHCNLNPQNIYLDENYYPKLAGFQYSQLEKPPNNSIDRFSKYKGCPEYFAPEIFCYKNYNKASDVFAFAVISYEIFTGDRLHSNFDFFKYIHQIVIDKKRPSNEYNFRRIPFYYREIIQKCWSDDPEERPTFDEIVQFLKTDMSLIDNEEFQKYVKLVDESFINYDESQEFHFFDEIINSSIQNHENLYSNQTNFDLNQFDKSHEYDNIFGEFERIVNKNTNEQFLIRCSEFPLDKFSENDIINLSNELSVISQINHPSIIKFIRYFSSSEQNPTIIQEYLPHYTLNNILNTYEQLPIWDETQKLIIIYGIASAMSFLHSHNILHRDLKPENIYLDELFFPKLSGFHLSKELPANVDREVCNEIKGTAIYLSPEVYKYKEYSKASDVYAFSLVIYQIITGKKIFEDLINVSHILEEVVQNKKRPEFNENIPKCYRELIEKCWSDDPKERPTFNEIVTALKTDQSFITSTINSEDYHKYIKMIDESNITFTPETKITYEDMTNKKIKEFSKNNVIQTFQISVLGVFETEVNNISLDFKYIDLRNFEELELIGQGSFSDVTKIRDRKTGNEYAAKYLTKNMTGLTKKRYILLSREVNFISQLNHPSIVKFIGFSPVNFENDPSPILVTEFSNNRSLDKILDMLQKNVEIPEWDDTKKLILIYGIAAAMAYIHSNDIIYQDLKPANILLDDYLFPKLFDFDCSIETSALFIDDQPIGTPTYMAPELLESNEKGKPIDVYAYALVFYEIITNLKLYPNITSIYTIYRNIIKNKERPKLPDKVPSCYRELIEKCWAHDPNDRPTFDEIVNILKTDSRFITDDVDEEEYKNYIKYIDGEHTRFEYHTVIDHKGNHDKNKIDTFNKIDLSSYLNEKFEAKEIQTEIKSIYLNQYIKQMKIGSGSFGTVYKTLEKKTGKIYAVKIAKFYLTQCTDDDVTNIEREINIISKLNHPAIVKFIGFNTEDFKEKPRPVIITEFVPNGSLGDILELDRKGCRIPNWDDTKKLICIYGIASAMSYLHHKDILHRDLKPANILINKYLFPKISDFGLSKDIGEYNNLISSGFKGTYAYSAPENFQNVYLKAGDVYAFAIIVYEIITGEFPYQNATQYQLLTLVPNGFRPEFKFDIPTCYRNLIEKCWSNNPNERPTFDEIVELLKTDQDFITDCVDENEFLDYVDFIDESNYDSKLTYYDPIFQNCIVDTLDLSKYKSCEKIYNEIIFDICNIIYKKSKEEYVASMFKIKINKISSHLIKEISEGLKIFSQLNHPLFAKFIGYSPVNFKSKQYPIVVYETGSTKTLRNIIDKEEIKLNETDKLIIIYGIAFGMRYLHSEDVIHRNLSINCIFLDEQLHPKISNLEFLKKVSIDSTDKDKHFLGIYSYSAPEIFKNKYSKSSDVYAFAMIVYEILSERNAYENVPLYQIQYDTLNGIRPEFTSKVPDYYQKLIEECWSNEISKRPTFDEIVERLKTNEFINENIDKNKFIKYIESIESLERDNATHIEYIEIKLSDENCISKEPEKKEEEDKSKESRELKFKEVSVNFVQDEGSLKDEPQDIEFLDLKKYKLGELISKQDYSKTYEVTSKDSGEVYMAKISTVHMNEFSRDELISLSREVNIISQLVHPSFLKFIGYSPVDFKSKHHPVIITELAKNGTLQYILNNERNNVHISRWNETTKLINLYGIAAGMKYLHSQEILHRDLNPTNIYLDDFLFPKIGDFGLSTKNHTANSMTYQSTSGLRGNPTYSSPEVLQFNEYTKSSDVYSFGFIAFEILTCEIPFKGIVNKNTIYNEVVYKESRPQIPTTLPQVYQKLIEQCWSQERNERPSFDDIVERLKSDSDFITERIQKEDYYNYIEFIDESQKSFNSTKKILDLSEFIVAKSKINEETIKMKIEENEYIEEEKIIEETVKEDENEFEEILIETSIEKERKIIDETVSDTIKMKIEENECIIKEETMKEDENKFNLNDFIPQKQMEKESNGKVYNIKCQKDWFRAFDEKLINYKDYISLDDKCKKLIDELCNDSNGQFTLAKSFIEGRDSFPFNLQNGIKFLKKSIQNGNNDAARYYCTILIEGKIIPRNISKAKKIIDEKLIADKPIFYLLKGKIFKVENNYETAIEYFKESIKLNNSESMYEYGKMLFKGLGTMIDVDKSMSYFKMASDNGCEKAMFMYGKLIKKMDSPLSNEEAITYIKKAADNGYSKAIYYLSIAYKEGNGVTQDDDLSFKYLEKAANMGVIEAMHKYGLILLNSSKINEENTTNSNEENSLHRNECIRYFKKASDRGNIDSIYQYGLILLKLHKEQAAKYIRIAADSNNLDAISKYACMLQNGDGVPMNKEGATKYYKMAIEKGDSNAKCNYEQMLKNDEAKELKE